MSTAVNALDELSEARTREVQRSEEINRLRQQLAQAEERARMFENSFQQQQQASASANQSSFDPGMGTSMYGGLSSFGAPAEHRLQWP